jgi:hypothetical protein
VPFRWRTASKGNDPGFHLPIHPARRIPALPTGECRFQTTLSKTPADRGDGVRRTAERLGYRFIGPVWTVGIHLQENEGMPDLICGCFTSGNELPQSFSFLVT